MVQFSSVLRHQGHQSASLNLRVSQLVISQAGHALRTSSRWTDDPDCRCVFWSHQLILWKTHTLVLIWHSPSRTLILRTFLGMCIMRSFLSFSLHSFGYLLYHTPCALQHRLGICADLKYIIDSIAHSLRKTAGSISWLQNSGYLYFEFLGFVGSFVYFHTHFQL